MSGQRHFMPDVQATGFDAKPAAESALVVGQVETVVGSCSLTRPGGDPFRVKPGDPICRGDILETTAGGKVGIRFIDGTAFSLSDSARAVVKEFGGDGTEPSALFDIGRGTFAFIAGEMAKLGGLHIQTPFASIRGRAQSGGIGMLSLASLFFAALENTQAATTPPGTEDGIINIRESSDIINAPFGIIELTVGSQTIFIDTPFSEFVVRGTSVSQLPLSPAQLQQFLVESNNVHSIAALGQGPTVGGPSGSSDAPPSGPPSFVTPINIFVPMDPVGPTGGSTGGGNSAGASLNLIIPPPSGDELPPPPPPPPPPTGGTAVERPEQTGNPSNDTTIGSLAFTGVDPGAPSFVWSGGPLTSGQTAALTSATSLTFAGPSLTAFEFNIQDQALDLLAANETLTITYNVTLTDGAGHTLTQPVVIVANGTNDAPIFTSSDPNILRIETIDAVGNPPTLIASGSLIFKDVDLNDVASTYTATITGLAVSGATIGLPDNATLVSYLTDLQIIKDAGSIFGHLDGQFAAPDSAFNYLSTGETVTLKYTVQIDDGHGGTATQFLTFTIQGSNDAPIVTGSSTTVSEEGLTGGIPDSVGNPTDTTDSKSASGQINVSDPDGDALNVTLGDPGAVLTSGGQPVIWTGIGTDTLVGKVGTTTILTVTIDNSGNYTVTLDGPIDHLNPSSEDIKTIAVPVAVSDGQATTPTTLLVTIEDDAPTAAADTDAVQSGAPATGNVITGIGTTNGGADTPGADGVTVTGVAAGTPGGNVSGLVGSPIATSLGTLTLNATGGYSYVAHANASGIDTFTYTITDSDGDQSTTTLTITLTDGSPSASPETRTVNEAALDTSAVGDLAASTATGSNPSSTAETVSGTLSFSDPDTPVTVTGVQAGNSGGSDVSGNVGSNVAGSFGLLHVNANGSYTYTLTTPVDNDTQTPVDVFTYTVTDSLGNTQTQIVTINITDDAPTAVDNTRNVVEGTLQSADVQFIVDLSGSMFASGGGGVGFDVPGFSDDRIGLARYSMQQLLLSNDQIENVQIIRFGDSASGTLWLTKAQALTFIQNDANWTSLGGTNYDAALQQAITSFGSGPASPSEQSIVYFMSDGAPTAGGGITSDGSGSNVSIAAWESHVTTKGIDQVFAIGIGNGVNVDNLEPIAFPNTDVQAPIGAEDNVILVSTSDVAALPNRLQDALELHSTISGNILLDDPGMGTGADSFGADGGRILKITIDGITYTYDPTGNDISASSGPQPTQDTPVLTVTTALGGTLTFHFAASGAHVAGDWSYLTSTAGPESFSYALVDGDGDQDTATLSINILPPPDLTFTLDLPGLNALQGSALNKFKPMGTFASGSTYTLGAGSDAGFAVSTDGILSTTSLGGQNIPSGTYTLNVIAIDSTGTSHTIVVKIVVGTTGPDPIDLATLGNPNGINLVYGLNGADVITGDGGNDFIVGGQQSNTLQAGSGPTTLVAGPQGDTLKSGTGVDIFFGAGGNDTFVVNSTTSSATVGGSGNNGTISGYDVINGFATASDFLDLQGTPTSATGTNVNGVDSTLTIGGQTVKSHTISNGIITFDDQNNYAAALSLTNTLHVAAVVDYLRHNNLGNAGATVAFTATINGTAHTYIYEQVGAVPNSANDILVDLAGVTLTSGGTSLSTLIANTHVKPAGIAGEPINLALSDPSPDQSDLITVTVSGLLPGWTLNGGALLSDGVSTVQTTDIQSLTVTPPADFAGALALNVTETWTNADGTPGIKTITDNLEAYAPGSPVFAWSGDDTLTGSSGQDLFVFSQPIGDDIIYNFNVSEDQIDLIGYAGFTSFDDVKNHLTTDVNGNAEITLADGQSITLYGLAAASLSAWNFVFDQTPVMNNAGTMTIGDGAILPLSGIINNTGTIALESAGSTTTLQLTQHGIMLQGGGQVTLSDSDENFISSAIPGVTLTNVDNTISGAGQLGDWQTILINQGTIVANGTHALTIDTGSNVVINSGVLEATGPGSLIVNSDVSNSGLIWADGGNITIEGAVTGTGGALISGGILEFFAASSIDVTFAEESFETLVLDNPTAFTGQIFGFAGSSSQDSDLIDLKGIAFDAGTSWTYYDSDGSDTGGTLTIYGNIDGTETAVDSIRFGNGDYTTNSFVLTGDGGGGVLIADQATSGSGTVIDAGNGGNTLTGTAASDTFVFKAITDSQPGAGNFDTITNFTHNSDHIDLTAIAGANAVQGPVDAASTADAHSISWFVDSVNNQTIVYVNSGNTANHVDMEIHLTGANINLTGSDILHHT